MSRGFQPRNAVLLVTDTNIYCWKCNFEDPSYGGKNIEKVVARPRDFSSNETTIVYINLFSFGPISGSNSDCDTVSHTSDF